LIYVGGTLVLLVFGVMLTAQSPFISMKTRGGDWVLAAIVGGSLLALLTQAAFSVADWQGTSENAEQVAMTTPTSSEVGGALSGVRFDRLGDKSAAETSDLAGYLLPFEIVSVHLLVVLIGAAYLARAKRRAVPRDVGVA
jgi:NADH-quinone oxidoreductase subunit J